MAFHQTCAMTASLEYTLGDRRLFGRRPLHCETPQGSHPACPPDTMPSGCFGIMEIIAARSPMAKFGGMSSRPLANAARRGLPGRRCQMPESGGNPSAHSAC